MQANGPVPTLEELLEQLACIIADDDLPPGDSPLSTLMRMFCQSNWENMQTGLLRRTDRIRMTAERGDFPRRFRFDIDLPFKRKLGPHAPVELMPGPIRGVIIYRPNLYAYPSEPAIAVRLDRTPGFFHANYSRSRHLLCLGHIPPGPFELNVFVESHLYPILSYQNQVLSDAFDSEAAAYFATHPDALSGLRPVPPLY